MNDQRPDNPFDAMRRVINHEANQDDDGGFFAKLGGIDPEPDDDGPTAKGLFQKINKEAWKKANPPIWPSTGGILPRAKTQLRKRRTIVRVRKDRDYRFINVWKWECQQCDNTWGSAMSWEPVIECARTHAIMEHVLPEYAATRHAQQHRSEK